MRLSPRLFVLAFGVAIVPPASAQSAHNDTLATSMIAHDHGPGALACVASRSCQPQRNLPVATHRRWRCRDSHFGCPILRRSGGFDINDNTSIRLGYTYTPSKLRYRDWSRHRFQSLDINEYRKADEQHRVARGAALLRGLALAGLSVRRCRSCRACGRTSVPKTSTLLTTPGGSQQFHWASTPTSECRFGHRLRCSALAWNGRPWGRPTHSMAIERTVRRSESPSTSRSECRSRNGGSAQSYYFGKMPPGQQPTVATSP